ncbi:hypothetical protein [Zobellia sp. 1_MG-2023]|uniref:hypothetical protein n=1 Tax=Zobellia sp. 1_MG-2023 TaxID=3062626 RepID=UPI0026E2C65E|nr:hypothetical protein [Zobellia sp. 1_MG-2023]MDO6820196.1 hypothetical protein [Zobellia sp. 1_MG-2023]
MKYLQALILVCVLITSCTNDDDSLEKTLVNEVINDTIAVDTTTVAIEAISDIEFEAKNFGAALTTNFIGEITDIDAKPLGQVKVTIGSQSVVTDTKGVFVLNEVTVNEKFAYIKAETEGYILGSRSIVPSASGSNVVNITLLKKNTIETVNSGETSEVSLENGAKVNFGGNFIDASGAPYNGKVEVSMHYLEPNQTQTFSQMPGSLFGKRENNEATAMETYGMLSVNLYSPNGEILNISEDTPAKLYFPVSSSTPNAPSSIPLWYFDEAVGYWKEQGVATIIDGEYVGEVSHFTWWNCDLPLNTIRACFELKQNAALPNSYFEITRASNDQLVYSGYTNELGQNCGLFPKEETLEITLFSDCDPESPAGSKEFGPFTEDGLNITINIDDLADVSITTLSATVTNCNNAPLTNGYAFIHSTNDINDFKILPITNGEIEQQLVYCNEADYLIVVVDANTDETSDEITLSSIANGITDLGQIQTCPNQGGTIYEGSITLTTQEEVDAFGAFGYSEITGDLRLNGQQSITSLESLSSLMVVGGEFYIETGAKNLNGLEKLETVGSNLAFIFNIHLTTLSALENLSSIGGNLRFTINTKLTSLTGLESLTSLNGIEINGNGSLTTLTGLENITSVQEYLFVLDNNNLTTLQGLNNVTSVGNGLTIGNNNKLNTLTGLDNIISVGGNLHIRGNENLVSLIGLENLNSVGNQTVIGDSFRPNPKLENFCALTNLFTTGTFSTVSISNNKYNPSFNDIYNGECEELPQSGGLYEGSITLTSQEDIENFGTIGYTEVTGDVIIMDTATPTITSLANLDYLTTIGGSLTISKTAVTNLQGLQNLTSIGNRLTISNNSNLTNITDLNNLTAIEGRYINISNNSELTSLSGLDNLTRINGELRIANNQSLTSLVGLGNITSIDLALIITQNMGLTSLQGLNSLNSIGQGIALYGSEYNTVGLQITTNSELTSFAGLNNVTALKGDLVIRHNAKLVTLEGLENVTAVNGHLQISRNSELISLKGLNNIASVQYKLEVYQNYKLATIMDLENLTTVGSDLSLHENKITSLNGFENLSSVGGMITIGASFDEDFNMVYGGNYNLTDFCALTNFIINGSYTDVFIEQNAYNPTVNDISYGSCSQ